MPSHIFTRLGMWQQSIDSNRAAHAAALAYVRKTLGPDGFDSETVHTMDYLEYAYLQTAQDRKAKQVVDELLGFRQSAGANLPTAYAVAAIPVRFALERRDWPAAAALCDAGDRVPARTLPVGRGDDLVCPRARRGTAPATSPAPRRKSPNCNRCEDKLLEAKDTYWANQVEVAAPGGCRHPCPCPGDDKKALELVRAAADLDATMDKHPATPAAVLPARELLADLLLELNQPGAAFDEYEAVPAHRAQPLPQPSRQGPRRQAVGRSGGFPRRLSKAGGAECAGR